MIDIIFFKIVITIKKKRKFLNPWILPGQYLLLSFLMCRLRLWDRAIMQTLTMNLRLAEYVIAFYTHLVIVTLT